MKKWIIILAAAALLIATSCKKVIGEGPVETERRPHTGFSGVSAGVDATVNYSIAPHYKVELHARRNILNVLETSIVDGHLLVKVKRGVSIVGDENIVINISAPTAPYLHFSGSGKLNVTGNIVSNNLDMSLSGSGDIIIDKVVIANKIETLLTGSGTITIKEGFASDEDVRISGSGRIKIDSVHAARARAKITGSGNIYINLSETLDATITGSGSIYYLGNAWVTTHITGSGKVIKL